MLDHIVYAVPDLARAVTDLEQRLGVRATPGGKHTGLGTHNALLSLSEESYIEVIGPDPEQPPPTVPRPFGIDALTGPRLVTWVAKATDLDKQVEQARARGYDLGGITPMHRDLPDGTRIAWRLAIPAQPLGDGLVPVLIEWHTALHPAKTSARGCTLVELHGEHPRPETVRPILEVMGLALDIRAGAAPALVATLDTPKGRVVLR
ncbi:MAG TPA: VOC family protein [Candidatus Binatia bacterium]|nr:VOC family protein [Candidatus Binatia bacterium]